MLFVAHLVILLEEKWEIPVNIFKGKRECFCIYLKIEIPSVLKYLSDVLEKKSSKCSFSSVCLQVEPLLLLLF